MTVKTVKARVFSKKIGGLLQKPPLLIVQSLLELLPFRPLEIALFYILQRNGTPINLAKDNDNDIDIRLAYPDDIAELTRCMNKRERFEARFAQGDSCIMALSDQNVVGFLWFSIKEWFSEERYGYRLDIPVDTVYIYDVYVDPFYRQKGILKQLWLFMARWMEKNHKNIWKIIIDYGNKLSWKVHVKNGFQPTKRIFFFRILRSRFYLEHLIVNDSRN